jgi:hypothetical protein
MIGSWTAPAAADSANDATLLARQRFFGAENVDARNGRMTQDRVIFSWVTNASLAVSLKGRIVLLDTYLNRPELPPPPGEADLRRPPIDV